MNFRFLYSLKMKKGTKEKMASIGVFLRPKLTFTITSKPFVQVGSAIRPVVPKDSSRSHFLPKKGCIRILILPGGYLPTKSFFDF